MTKCDRVIDIASLALMACFAGLVVYALSITASRQDHEEKACEDRGGAYVKGVRGYLCVQALKEKP